MRFSRKQLKANARQTIRSNKMTIIIVCFIISLIAGDYSSTTTNFQSTQEGLYSHQPPTLSDTVGGTIGNILGDGTSFLSGLEGLEDMFTLRGATQGAIATIINNSGESNSVVIGILNSINIYVFDNKIVEASIVLLAALIAMLFGIFVKNLLIVGQCRFFLEIKNYSNTEISKILFAFRVKKTFNIVYIMFFRSLYSFLWAFTIIGGVIKHYSYRMIPYILAENPEISCKNAFSLSKQMMKGNKWNAFKLDASFLLWNALSVLTLGILGIVYVKPLIGATNSELYFALRSDAIKANIPLSTYLNDKYLTTIPPNDITTIPCKYPIELFAVPLREKQWITLDYQRSYSFVSIIYIFFFVAFIGWFWEVVLHIFTTGTFINRGILFGPWLPIYGVGSVLMLILLKPLAKRPITFFISTFIVCGILEYFTSWALQILFNEKWWDYTNVFFNLNGRVCLEGLLFFATGGLLIIYGIAPLVDDIIKLIPKNVKIVIIILLILAFSMDLVSSYFNPNQGDGITSTIVNQD